MSRESLGAIRRGLNSIKTAAIILSPGKRVELANAHALELCNCRDNVELNDALLVPERELDSALENARREPQEHVIKFGPRTIQLHISYGDRGWIILAHDLAVLQDLQRCMKAASVTRARERMSGTLMHSLKGPMHAMTLTLDVLRKAFSQEPRQQHYLEALAKELSRLNDSLEAMFAESRPASMMTEFDLSELISELATRMRVETALREVTIKLNLAEQTTMLGRQRDIKHALAAIMLNSIDASSDGGEVEVKLTREDPWARITISGDPLSNDWLDIDLEVARQIAREHGGELYSDSSRRICFKLPLKNQDSGSRFPDSD